ncbi:hypothetical protein [Cupriavidus basilensis]|uniref:thiolase family protein n=1 Tax=Cupriavidus basilensis TaxID=68895 RepID=UPI0023E7D3AD|nr:hypothetical protein [Cupriavidus basilensis]MDF3887551.1 hypothetical protein [Cupriavidus basilensis]
MRNVAIAGVGMTPFGEFLNRNLKSLCEEAVQPALADANVKPDYIQRVFVGNAAAGVVTGQETIRAQASLRTQDWRASRCTTPRTPASPAVRRSTWCGWLWYRVNAKRALVVGSEKLSHEDKAVSFGAFGKGGGDLEEPLPAGAGVGQRQPVHGHLRGEVS